MSDQTDMTKDRYEEKEREKWRKKQVKEVKEKALRKKDEESGGKNYRRKRDK
jgi:hypothetical protein